MPYVTKLMSSKRARDTDVDLDLSTLGAMQNRELWRADTLRWQPHAALVWLTRGQGRAAIGGRVRGLGPHTMLYVPPFQLFQHEFFAGAQGVALTLKDRAPQIFPDHSLLLKASTSEHQVELTQHFDALARELQADHAQIGRARIIEAHLLLISVVLDRLMAAEPKLKLSKSHKLLGALAAGPWHKPSSPAEIADRLGVTTTHLSRLTQEALGKPLSRVVQEARLNAACDALARSETPAGDISRTLGFASPSHFSKAFGAEIGQTPSQFRRLHKRS